MAEVLLEPVKIILEKLITGAINKAQFALEIESHIKDLENTLTLIEASLLDSDSRELSPAQCKVLKRLSRVAEKMHDFMDLKETRSKQRQQIMTKSNLAQKVHFYLVSSNRLVHSFQDIGRVESIRKDLASIERDSHLVDTLFLRTTQRLIPPPITGIIGPCIRSEEVIGRDWDRDNILSMLHSTETLSVLAITGIGGIGKTTLAQYLYSTESVKTNFDVLLWVSVGQVFILEEIIRKMVGFGTGERNLVDCDMAQLQNCILTLISGKKCLLVLDNVWDHRDLSLNWQELMKLNGYMGVGSRFIVTTRSESVARIMSNNDPYRLGDLDAQDAWRLFRKVGCRRQQLEPELERIGREIARLCGNVPLVIRVIGGLLREKPTTVEAWSDFRDDLGCRSCCGRESSIMHILKLSYDQLHPKGLKRCFLHFSLFPRGFLVSQNELIYQWRALGFVETQGNQGEEYITCLINRGLLLSWSTIFFMMHDLIHDLAISLAKSKYKLMDSDECDFIDNETQHVSYTRTAKFSKEEFLCSSLLHIKDQLRSLVICNSVLQFDVSPRRVPLKLKLKGLSNYIQLRVFSLGGVRLKEVPSSIDKLIRLRYLDLSHNSFAELPNSITQLVNLLYLNLEWCMDLRKLPSNLCKLVDLEFIGLRFCDNLEELPRDINKLEKLLHLELSSCYKLKQMPSGLGKLTGLQTLPLFVVRGHSWTNQDVSGIADLNSLNNLKGRLKIVVEGCCLPASEVRAANLQAKEKLEWLWIEFIEGAYADTEVLEQFRPPSNLTTLVIKGYKGRSPPSWIDDRDRFLNLEELEILHWEGFSFLGSLGRFPHLRIVAISDCKNMEYIIDDSSASSSLFPRLNQLTITDAPKLKGWRRSCISKSSDCGSVFPKLKFLIFDRVGLEIVPEEFRGLPLLRNLEFGDCEQLKEIPEWIDTFPSLKKLTIWNCARLMSLPKQIANLTNLEILQIRHCPSLAERCQIQTGEDWHFIQHIPNIDIQLEFESQKQRYQAF